MAVQVRQINPGYLRTMRIPVLRGRDIVENDADVLLVSRDAACIGERTIRSGAAPPCQPCRQRCFGRWSESLRLDPVKALRGD